MKSSLQGQYQWEGGFQVREKDYVHLEADRDPKTGYGHGSATLQLPAPVLHACVCSCRLGLHLGVHLLRSVGLDPTSR